MHNQLANADVLLERLGEVQAKIEEIEGEFNEQIESIQGAYAKLLEPLVEKRRLLDKDLLKLMKKQTSEIFEGEDKVSLPHGILLHAQEWHVAIPRGALERIEELGWDEAIKIAKSVDRGVIEGWPEERLFAIGSKRELKDKFAYELNIGD